MFNGMMHARLLAGLWVQCSPLCSVPVQAGNRLLYRKVKDYRAPLPISVDFGFPVFAFDASFPKRRFEQ